jgi:hypothetical protein
MSHLPRPKRRGFFVPKQAPRTVNEMSATDQYENIAAMIVAGDDTFDVGVADRDSEVVDRTSFW